MTYKLYRLKTVFLSLLIVCSNNIHSANVIFDLGGVLIDTSKYEAISQIGFFNLIRHHKNPRLLFFSYYDSILPRTIYEYIPTDDLGNPLPQIMCDWLSGAQTSSNLFKFVVQNISRNKKLSEVEKKIIINFSRMIFDNDEFVKTKRFIKDGVRFVKKCKRNGHKVFILSNWDDSIDLMRRMHPDFFNLFDGVIISAEVHLLKPHPSIYTLLMDTFNLNPEQTVLIDDESINLKTAYELGIYPILCTKIRNIFSKPDFTKAEKEFDSWLERNT